MMVWWCGGMIACVVVVLSVTTVLVCDTNISCSGIVVDRCI